MQLMDDMIKSPKEMIDSRLRFLRDVYEDITSREIPYLMSKRIAQSLVLKPYGTLGFGYDSGFEFRISTTLEHSGESISIDQSSSINNNSLDVFHISISDIVRIDFQKLVEEGMASDPTQTQETLMRVIWLYNKQVELHDFQYKPPVITGTLEDDLNDETDNLGLHGLTPSLDGILPDPLEPVRTDFVGVTQRGPSISEISFTAHQLTDEPRFYKVSCKIALKDAQGREYVFEFSGKTSETAYDSILTNAKYKLTSSPHIGATVNGDVPIKVNLFEILKYMKLDTRFYPIGMTDDIGIHEAKRRLLRADIEALVNEFDELDTHLLPSKGGFYMSVDEYEKQRDRIKRYHAENYMKTDVK